MFKTLLKKILLFLFIGTVFFGFSIDFFQQISEDSPFVLAAKSGEKKTIKKKTSQKKKPKKQRKKNCKENNTAQPISKSNTQRSPGYTA